jgi:hypothetical protein
MFVFRLNLNKNKMIELSSKNYLSKKSVMSIFAAFFLLLFSQFSFAQSLENEDNIFLARQDFLENLKDVTKNIEETKQDVVTAKLKLNLILNERSRVLKEIENEVPQIELVISGEHYSSNREVVRNAYDKTTLYWRILADNSLEFFSEKDNFSLPYPKILSKNIIILDGLENDEIVKKYLSLREELSLEYNNFLEAKSRFVAMVEGYQSELLLRAGKDRAILFNIVLDLNPNYIKYDKFYFDDLTRELKLIPYRPAMFFYSKILSYKKLSEGGFSGLLSIASQIFILIFLSAALISGAAVLKKATIFLEKLREKFVRYSFQNQKYNRLSILFTRVSPHFPWIFLIATFNSFYFFIELTSLPEISAILPYFIYYFLYRIFKIAFSSILSKAVSLNYSDDNLNKKIRKTSQSLGLYLLASLWFLHLTKTIVRPAIIYNLVLDVFLFGLIFIAAYFANKWREEIAEKFKEHFPKKSYQEFSKVLFGKFSAIFSLPILSVILVKISLYKFFDCFSGNDFFKRILAQIYRKKLESAAKKIDDHDESKIIPASYIENFKVDEEQVMQIKSHPYKEVEEVVESWVDAKIKENSMVIYGESGIGKTSLLNWTEKQISKKSPELKIIRINFDKKITKKSQFVEFISNHLEGIDSADSLEKFVGIYPSKTMIILDRCENLFLSKKNGFEAFKFFADLVNASSRNLFWIASFHSYSWNYLSNAIDHSNYFRYLFKLNRWSDSDIKNLIVQKHEKSGLKLVYDSLIFEIQSQDSQRELNDIQEKFFKMLWGQSRGNPKSAMHLWISALRVMNSTTLKITLPKAVRFSDLIKLSDDQLFVYAAISKHCKLSTQEVIAVTNLSKGVALNSIRIGMERGYLRKQDDGSYRLSDSWQVLISSLLINKNFIYE